MKLSMSVSEWNLGSNPVTVTDSLLYLSEPVSSSGKVQLIKPCVNVLIDILPPPVSFLCIEKLNTGLSL